MNKAAELLYQYNDLTSFSKLHTDVKTNNCKITLAHWQQVSPIKWEFTITADRFLRNMVRAMVGSLLAVGSGKEAPEWIAKMLEAKDRCKAGNSVPGNALFLTKIEY